MTEDIYAFDDCSIFHMCKLNIKYAFKPFFKEEFITHRNYNHLSLLLKYLKEKSKIKAKFVPCENFEKNILKSYDDLLIKQGNIQILGESFKKSILEQLEQFYEELVKEFKDIEKDDDIDSIKTFFVSNERQLNKNPKIPEDDDLKIISAYFKFACIGNKYFISEDEHFWGYEDLIKDKYKFIVIKEWECYKLNIS